MKLFKHSKRGQALIMITTSLIALCGIMGLAVDVGWGYFVKKSAQRAADAAALATVEQGLAKVGVAGQFTCGGSFGVMCQTGPAYQCPANPNSTAPLSEFDAGCLYAKQNGFSLANANQNVLIDSGINATPASPIPTAPGIGASYWATVRTTQQIPQLFSAVLRFPWGQSSARATAAIIDVPVDGSLFLINRQNDANANGDPVGSDLDMQGGGSITVSGGMYMASTGACSGSTCAGHLGGSSTVTAAYVGLRGTGSVNNPSAVTPSPVSGLADQPNFKDPEAGHGQPPPPTAAQAPDSGGVYDKGSKTNGLIDGTSSCQTIKPGTYYAIDKSNKATGGAITLKGCINFVDSSGGTSGFGNYVFLGGLNMTGSGSAISMIPGRYIVAGVQNGGNSGVHLVNMDNAVTVTDQTAQVGGNTVANTDAGEVMVFTDANYTGGNAQDGFRSLYIPSAISNALKSTLVYGDVNIQMGNTAQSLMNLHGLNANATTGAGLPSELTPYAPAVFWQDQGNSKV